MSSTEVDFEVESSAEVYDVRVTATCADCGEEVLETYKSVPLELFSPLTIHQQVVQAIYEDAEVFNLREEAGMADDVVYIGGPTSARDHEMEVLVDEGFDFPIILCSSCASDAISRSNDLEDESEEEVVQASNSNLPVNSVMGRIVKGGEIY